MATWSEIPDDAIVLRHIPGGVAFQQPPSNRITSVNFQLRPGEAGVSVTLSFLEIRHVDAERMLRRLNRTEQSRAAFASFREISQLGFDVVRDPIAEDPLHALIVSGTKKLESHPDRKRLAMLFKYVV